MISIALGRCFLPFLVPFLNFFSSHNPDPWALSIRPKLTDIRNGGNCYGYILQSFLKIRKLLNSEKNEPINWKFREENSNGTDIPDGFFFRKFGRNLARLLPEIPDNYCAFHSAQEISRNGESFRANGKRLVYFFAYKPFQQKVHFHTKAGKKNILTKGKIANKYLNHFF